MHHKKINAILNTAAEALKPMQEEKRKVHTFILLLNKQLKKTKISAIATVGGSFAKDVWLRGDHDVDVFVKFSLKNADKNTSISDKLEKAIKKYKSQKVHGSRDYFQIKKEGLTYELVPVLNITKRTQAKNVTDHSPLHVKWVNNKGKNYKKDIRLAKKFCKANHIYGAESYIKGFSGHVLDVLIIQHKGFINLLNSAINWKPKTVINTDKLLKANPLYMINTSKTQGPLIVVDPIDPYRNAAAAVGMDAYKKFISIAKNFLKKPSLEYFQEKIPIPELLIEKGAIIIKALPAFGKEDVVGAKLLAIFNKCKKQLEPFGVKKAFWHWNKNNKNEAIFAFFVAKKQLIPLKIIGGPPIKLQIHAQRFKEIHKKNFVKKGKLYAKILQKYKTPAQALQALFKEKQIKEKVRKLEMIIKIKRKK